MTRRARLAAIAVDMRAAAYADAKLRRPPSVERLITFVSERFDLTRAQVLGPRQFKPNVAARAELARLLRERGNSLEQIGLYIGGRHHTTVRNLLQIAKSDEPLIFCEPPDVLEPDESGVWAI